MVLLLASQLQLSARTVILASTALKLALIHPLACVILATTVLANHKNQGPLAVL
jgi:hypothetical protein